MTDRRSEPSVDRSTGFAIFIPRIPPSIPMTCSVSLEPGGPGLFNTNPKMRRCQRIPCPNSWHEARWDKVCKQANGYGSFTNKRGISVCTPEYLHVYNWAPLVFGNPDIHSGRTAGFQALRKLPGLQTRCRFDDDRVSQVCVKISRIFSKATFGGPLCANGQILLSLHIIFLLEHRPPLLTSSVACLMFGTWVDV